MITRWVTAVVMVLVAQFAAADEYAATIERFGEAGAAKFVDSAYGYAVFPTIGKGGIGIGAAYGEGRVFKQGEMVGKTNLKQVTIGFQLGGQAYSQVIFFQDQRAFDEFTSGSFEFGAQATAVALTAGVSAEANTGGGTGTSVSGGQNDADINNSGYHKGMAVFTIAKGGLMYEASIGGQKFEYKPL
jgi:lipid-binding SYLF domain-containing protein